MVMEEEETGDMAEAPQEPGSDECPQEPGSDECPQEPGSDECPVCHEEYIDPKILPCTHRVCRKCVQSWLERKDNDGGCPMCHRPILSPALKDQDDMKTLVDGLPTDYALKVKLESQRILKAEDICDVCDSKTMASSFCIQCDIKLCSSCVKVHRRVPATTDHVIEDLSTLTADHLTGSRRFPCSTHEDKAAEGYCVSHEQLICRDCLLFSHRKCDSVQEIACSAAEKRTEMKDMNKSLRQKEKSIRREIDQLDNSLEDDEQEFDKMLSSITETFGSVQKSSTVRQQSLMDSVQKRKKKFTKGKKARRAKLDTMRSVIAAHANNMDSLVTSAPDKPLLAMFVKMKSQLDDLKSEEMPSADEDEAIVGNVYLDKEIVSSLKTLSEIIGELRDDCPLKQDEVGAVSRLSFSTVSEGTFRFALYQPHQLTEEVTSPTFVIKNIPWKIVVRPEELEDEQYLGLYLENSLPSSIRSWSCEVTCTLRILKASGNGVPEEEKLEKTLSNDVTSWGWPQFITMKALTDPKEGYMKDGAITVEAHVIVGDAEVNFD